METEKNRADSGKYFQNLLSRKPYRIGAIHCCALDFTNLGDEADDRDTYNQQADKQEETGLLSDDGKDR